jgi:1-acyl-sn-glycerol-3-phosphate acyltransferase
MSGGLQQPALPYFHRAWRTVRSVVALGTFLFHVTFIWGPVQRLIVFPLVWLRPGRRTHILGRWIRYCARGTRRIVTGIGGVRIAVSGVSISESAIVLMNHQSVLDVMIALCEVDGPTALIPVRTRYRWGIPTISPYIRAAGYPFIGQRRATLRADLAALAQASARAAAGDVSLVFFPEGHRTRDGDIGPFMPRGVTTALGASRRPVYCMVGDGMWKARTMADSLVRLADMRAAVRVSGPFMAPADAAELPRFIASLREHMMSVLREMRSEPEPASGAPVAVGD